MPERIEVRTMKRIYTYKAFTSTVEAEPIVSFVRNRTISRAGLLYRRRADDVC
jgi:hypothetical protein